MSKQDNLTDFLTGVADAIREVKGTSEEINPQDFDAEIRSCVSTLGTKTIVENGDYDAVDDGLDGYSSVRVEVPESTLITKTITANGNYPAIDDGADGYSQVTVAVPMDSLRQLSLNMASGSMEILPTSGNTAMQRVIVVKPDTFIPSNIRDGITIGGVTGTYTGGGGGGGQFDGIVDGSIQNMVIPSTYSTVRPSFYYWSSDNTSLQTLDLGSGVTSIGDNAFYNNRNAKIVCEEVNGELFFPRQIVSFGARAFCNCRGHGKGTTITGYYTFQPNSAVINCGNYAFQYAHVGKIIATFSTNVGKYAFSGAFPTEVNVVCNAGIGDSAFALDTRNLTKFHIKVSGAVGSSFLYSTSSSSTLVSTIDFYFDPTSNIISLANSSFAGMLNRNYHAYASPQIFVLDLRNSTFTSAPSYSFGAPSSAVPFGYIHVYMPTTCTALDRNAFDGAVYCVYYFSATTPPSAQASTFSSDTNTYYCAPYNNLNAYKTATNWVSKAAQIVGWVEGVTSLPATNSEGYNLLWYTDVACTTAVADPTSVSSDTIYYCQLNGLA